MAEVKQNKSPWLRIIIAAGIFIIVILNVIVVSTASRNFNSALEDARANGRRLANAMSEQLDVAFYSVDEELKRLADDMQASQSAGKNPPQRLRLHLQEWLANMPLVGRCSVLDGKGHALLSVAKEGARDDISIRDSIFALATRRGKASFLFVGRADAGGAAKQPPILMARRVRLNDGSSGMAVAAIDPELLIRSFRMLDPVNPNYMSLQLLGDGALLFASEDGRAVFGEINASSLKAARTSLSSDIQVSTHYDKTAPDEYYAFKRLDYYPAVLTIVMNENNFLRIWREERLSDLELLGIFLFLCAMLTCFAMAMAAQITKGQRLEAEAIFASQAKTEFLTSMSHELRTPLNAIIGYAEMISFGYFGALDPRLEERMNDIHLCGSHLLQLVSDILEFSKGNAGKLDLMEEQFHLHEIVNEAVRIMKERIRAKHIDLRLEIAERLPPLMGDKLKVRQILFNLLSNSLKFTPEGGTISLSTFQGDTMGQALRVADTGIGIAPEDIPVALSVFGQAHRDKNHEGTGLGLPLCKMFAELHGGELILESVPGLGTTVTITFSPFRNVIADDFESFKSSADSPEINLI